ncbi:MAG: right-handed parallel beta-helix repeat-containing protein [Nitrospirota bacterium]
MKKFLGFVGILGVLVLGWENLGFCGKITVSETTTVFTTIQAAINACPVGGTVSVEAGTYTEAIYINKKIALVGIGGPTIDASSNPGRTVTFDGTSTSGGVISGFRITGATADGIYCKNGATPIITNNTISENGGKGIYCDYSSPIITNNIITENTYCGISCWNNSAPVITNNIVIGNGGSGISCYNNSSPVITNNIIIENVHYGIENGSGIPTIDYNRIWSNATNNYYNISPGTNDISDNPQLIAPTDFHLGSTSPCINKGSNTAPAIPSTDKDGKPRIANGIVDMGAYEYQSNQPQLPSPDIKANGSDGIITITPSTSLSITIKLDAGDSVGKDADWWLVAETPFGWYRYNVSGNTWVSGFAVSYQGHLFDLTPPFLVLNSPLPIGTYTFYFGVDMLLNGSLDFDKLYYDSVVVNVK